MAYDNASQVLSDVQEKYAQIRNLKIEFEQTLINAQSGQKNERNGEIFFKRPGYIRWQTSAPQEEIILIHQDIVWNYIPKERVAYKYFFSQMFQSKNFIAILTGRTDIKNDFYIKEHHQEDNGWLQYVLEPKQPETSLVLAKIWIDPESLLLQKIYFEDFFQYGNQITFNHIELNPELKASLFDFSPPEDVEVIDNTSCRSVSE
jgi:outer membrane lipoprotein carrier protein